MATDSISQPTGIKFTTQYPNLRLHSRGANGDTPCDRLLRANDRPGVKIFFKKEEKPNLYRHIPEFELSIAIHKALPEFTPRIYRTVEQDGKTIGQIMRRVDGITLAEAIGTCLLPDGIELQIKDAMSRLHSSGFVYNDLSVWNTLLEADCEGRTHVFLIDFGLSDKSTDLRLLKGDADNLKAIANLIAMCRQRHRDVDNTREAIYKGLSKAKEDVHGRHTVPGRYIDADDAFLTVRRELKRGGKARESFERLMKLSSRRLYDLLIILLRLEASKLQRGFSYRPTKIAGDLLEYWTQRIYR